MITGKQADAHERLKSRRDIVTRHLQIERWINSKLGEFTCPAGHAHAWAMIDGPINLYCPGGQERTCYGRLQQIVTDIREEVREQEGKEGFAVWEPTEQDRQQQEQKLKYYDRVAFLARTAKPIALANRKTLDDLRAASPVQITHPINTHWRLPLQHLFEPDHVIWIGETHETSNPEFAGNFRTVRTWLTRREDYPAYGPQWSPACWKSNTFCRKQTEVRTQRYYPVEGDVPLSLRDQATLLLWLAKAYPLVSVTFSGRVSLHALFMKPRGVSADSWQKFKAVLEAFEFDLGNFRVGGTTRCPGWFRAADKPDMKQGSWQELLYLNPEPWKQLNRSLS